MVNKNNLKNLYLSILQHQDSIMQNYRIMFLTSSTFLVSISIILLTQNFPSIKQILLLLFIINSILIVIWIYICWRKGLNVSYCQNQIKLLEKNELPKEDKKNPYSQFVLFKGKNIYEKEKMINSNDTTISKKFARKKIARLIMGFFLPCFYILIWVIILIISLII